MQQDACAGKRRLTHQEAAKTARYLKDGPVNIYRCPHCRWWHVGNLMPQRRDKRKQAKYSQWSEYDD